MKSAHIDFETASTVELKRTGVYPYALHHDTRIWCMAWAIGDDEPELWIPGQPFPERLQQHLDDGGTLHAWNAQFERIMWRDCATVKYNFPEVPSERFYCTMVQAYAMALPGQLEKAALVLEVVEQKDMGGNRLSKQMCRPRRFSDEGEPIWWDDPERLAKLYEYCRQDVRAERSVAKRLNPLNATERAVYLRDQAMNDKGIFLDHALVVASKKIAEREIRKHNRLLSEATDGAVTAVTQVGKLKEWLAAQGIEAESLGKDALTELLSDGDLTGPATKALAARQAASKSSLAKLDAMIDCVGLDQRMRGLQQYHSASTGRWGGRLVQPHNFVRPTRQGKEIDDLIERIFAEDPDLTLLDLSDVLRSCMTAAPGYELVAADYAAIEARVLAWVAQDANMLDTFRENRPIYKEMAGVIFNKPASAIVKPSPEYQLGKNTVLGCGFQMGKKKFAETTGVSLEVAERAVKAYRGFYPMVPRLWTCLNDAAIRAVEMKNSLQVYSVVRMVRRGGYLYIILPSGRALAYANPKIVDRPVPWDEHDMRPAVEFSGTNSYTHQWERMCLYGGLITENVVQATARDLLAATLLKYDDAILTVHDEIVREVPEGHGEMALQDLIGAMRTPPVWGEGIPVDAEGWFGLRYRK